MMDGKQLNSVTFDFNLQISLPAGATVALGIEGIEVRVLPSLARAVSLAPPAGIHPPFEQTYRRRVRRAAPVELPPQHFINWQIIDEMNQPSKPPAKKVNWQKEGF